MRASEMRNGQTVKIDGKLYAIVDYQHVKLGKGGAVYQTKLKSLTDGSIQNTRLRSEEIVEEAYLDKRTYEYLYILAKPWGTVGNPIDWAKIPCSNKLALN